MRRRRFGRTNWMVSEIGYGMWGMGSWSGSDDDESLQSLQYSIDLGCNFFDTAWGYGEGHSERLLAQILRANPDKRLYVATKIPPKNWKWPSRREDTLDDCFPPEHVDYYLHSSLENLGVSCVDLIQFHTWEDSWLEDDRLVKIIDKIRSQGLAKMIGISLNRGEPWNGIKAVQSGLIDVVQVVYNIFEQSPDDELFPACLKMDVGVIARVPFDEGSLVGNLTLDSKWPEGDFRNVYFAPEKLKNTVERIERMRPLVPSGMTMAEMAMRFILNSPAVSTIIPGMRKLSHVESNIACSDAGPLPGALYTKLLSHRWDRNGND